MPSGRFKDAQQAGFTLVEVLCVLVIIGLMSSAVVMSVPKPKPASLVQSTQVLTQFNRASQMALISGKTQGFGLSKSGYAAASYEGQDWVYGEVHPWAQSVSIVFSKDEQTVTLGETLAPLIYFDSAGLSTIFTLSLSGEDQTRHIQSQGDGRVTIETAS